MKPFTYRPPPTLSTEELTTKAGETIAALDDRGAWLQPLPEGQDTTTPPERRFNSGTFYRNMQLLGDYLTVINK